MRVLPTLPERSSEPLIPGDHIEAALEASCGALLALESALAQIELAGGGLDGRRSSLSLRRTRAHAKCAAESVRLAIDELRPRLSEDAASLIEFGFVLGQETESEDGRDSRTAYGGSLRTT